MAIKGHLSRGSDKIKFTIPEGWKELTLETYEKISDDMNALDIFSLLSGLDIQLVRKCDAQEVEFLVSQMDELFNPKDLETDVESIDSFKINDRTFNVPSDLLSIKAGQYYDIKKIEEMYKDKPLEAVRKLLSYIILEEGKEYDYKDTEEKYNLFKQLDVQTAFKVRTFFLTSHLLSMTDSNRYLKKTSIVKRLLLDMIHLVKSTVVYLLYLVLHKTRVLLKVFSGLRKR